MAVPAVRLDPVPERFKSDPEVWRFLNQLRERVGGTTGDIIYSAAEGGLSNAPIPTSQAVADEVLSQVAGLLAPVGEPPADQLLLVDAPVLPQVELPPDALAPVTPPPLELPPDDPLPLGAIIEHSRQAAKVQSVFGRIGSIVAQEGDYSLTLLSDVTITGPTTNQVLTFNGTTWVNGSVAAGIITGVLPVANGGTGVATLPTGSVVIGAGTSPVTTVAPGASGNLLTSNGTTWVSSAPASAAPQYQEFTASAGQTVFNTSIPTVANGGGRSYLLISLNGVVMREGASNDYTVTGANQVTFTFALVLNDVVTMRAFA